MSRKKDVNANADAIQNDEVDEQVKQGKVEQSEKNEQPELEIPAFVSNRQQLADEILERQREQRNREIAEEMSLARHPDDFGREEDSDENNDSDDEDLDENNIEQDETEDNEINENDAKNIRSDTETDEDELNKSAQDVDQNKKADLKLDKPGFYGNEVVLKIDGQLVKMPAEKALSILQKNQAADRRLENIVLRERQLSAREEQLKQQNRPQPSEPVKMPDVVEDADIEKRARTIVQSVEDGEQEKAVESLVALVKNTVGRQVVEPQPTLTPEQITALVDQRSRAMEATTVEGRLKSSGNYDDIFSDDIAYSLAIENVRHLNTLGYDGTTEQLMVEAMERVRDWRSGFDRETRLERERAKLQPEPKPKPEPAPEISEPQRLEKKRQNARPVKSSTTIQRQVQKQVEPEQSELEKRRSIFDSIKSARHQ